jgi:hypothetical protein
MSYILAKILSISLVTIYTLSLDLVIRRQELNFHGSALSAVTKVTISSTTQISCLVYLFCRGL